MVQGLGVCIASFAIFITYIVFGLMSPRNKSKKVVLPPLGLLFCIIHYGLDLMMLYGFFETYIAKAAARSLWVLSTFGITGVFYLQNAGFMNDPKVIGKKLSIAAYTSLVSVVLFIFNAFAACVRKQAFVIDGFRFVEITELLIHIVVIGLLVFYRKQYSGKIFTLLISGLLFYFLCWVSCILIYAFKIESHYYYVRELNPVAIATMVQICIQFFVFYNVVYGKFFENRIKLEHSLISVSQSQIQPHFVNNVLYNIKVLYSADPERAERMLDNLSKFLNGNKDAFDTGSIHPFVRELEHIKCYLEIEKERFDNISVVYDIGVQDFLLPPLTLQPIVENSIQHGLRPKKSGGTITVSTYRKDGNIIISVKDNGIGFDMTKPMDSGRKHLGMENTKFRIEKICNGTLDVKSIENAGTEVLITIPASV
ncbi:sensor histidine kinase [Treponema sp.]|uniref:sensor histidine kinase n=1 Tax=Treponema sp. TaxID=166 RepID=UPI00298DC285|nr:histidine kinase [Treponema sp.]MCQ2241634.1 histidine kinase [Treponema sp.]